ncbi:hypothetical protein [Lactobacillus sp.]|uniref:hypothetical protein n=1 Tax=Lactobacillus sp. TaxID=1591 RepID=UPI001997DC58|nr:hypothetical protein [Lactobacillus sp.]MBD5429293.1 hypothetical protein [Lactobacillus sp.]
MKEPHNLANFLKNINQLSYIPVIGLTLLGIAIWVICLLLHVPTVGRVGAIFAVFNSLVAYIIGRILEKRKLSRWWLLLFPVTFAIIVTIYYAQYNYLFCVIYLCMELFGLWHDSFYREKN